MLINIKNKKLNVIMNNEVIDLPSELKEKINSNFNEMQQNGANVWNGEVLCVSEYKIENETLNMICKKSNYAHYLYGEHIGCPKEYECKNLSAGCLIETLDGFYVVGELADHTSYPTMIQVTGGGIDKLDITDNNINILQTILREAKEELNLDLTNNTLVVNNEISYMYISEKNEQPGVQFFSKAKINMTAKEFNSYFEKYYKYLKENNLEIEFSKLHFIHKENVEETLKKLDNPKRNYLMPLLLEDSKEKKIIKHNP